MSKQCPPDKILNPKTKRCVLRTGKIGKELQDKEEKKQKSASPIKKVKEVKEERKERKERKPKEKKQERKIKSKDLIKKVKENKENKKSEVKDEIKPKVQFKLSSSLKSYDYITSLNKIQRFENFNIIRNYLNKLIKINNRECIIPYSNEVNKYLLTDNILLYKQIGSKSVYGVVYKSKNINPNYTNIPFFTAKIQLNTEDVKKETALLNYLTEYAINNNIPNVPLVYKSLICENIIRDAKYPLLLANAKKQTKKYSILLNEIASGDLNYFSSYDNTKIKITEEIWKNVYEQTFISLAILHSLGIRHNDTHNGNFLYHKIKPGGCFHYCINGTDFYIKNVGILWTSWDYGLATKIYNFGQYIFDYMRLATMLRQYDETKYTDEYKNNSYYKEFNAWGYSDISSLPDSIITLENIIFNHLGGFSKKDYSYNIIEKGFTEDKWLKYLLDNNILFSKVPIGTVLTSSTINFIKYTGSFLYDTNKDFVEINKLIFNRLVGK